ncbi:hypothetical protein QYF36_006900 [Acer negundo]|nr:hypothetical protein QYF36_006900 [Acer negundo]
MASSSRHEARPIVQPRVATDCEALTVGSQKVIKEETLTENFCPKNQDIQSLVGESSYNIAQAGNRGPNPVPEASQMDTEKLMKRMESNREASRRSRLRKKQHVEQLERSISFTEMDLAMISPQIAYYQNCNKRLEMKNNEMRKRLVAAELDRAYEDGLIGLYKIDPMTNMKRLIANRESARRSWLRQKEHTAQLEIKRELLQIKLSNMYQLRTYCENEHRRLLMENNQLRKSLAAVEFEKDKRLVMENILFRERSAAFEFDKAYKDETHKPKYTDLVSSWAVRRFVGSLLLSTPSTLQVEKLVEAEFKAENRAEAQRKGKALAI